MCCGEGDWSDCTARWQAIGGRRIKRNAGHERMSIPTAVSIQHLSRWSSRLGNALVHVMSMIIELIIGQVLSTLRALQDIPYKCDNTSDTGKNCYNANRN